ncbi:MAG TPA: hypothetical protein VFL57_06115 [Bryobacteraceae bacterium]|nr:hypothetical protein [Bryobacteraceae bacterium]
MKRRTFLAAGAAVSVAVPELSIAADGASAGFAEQDITPDIGMEQPGGYGKSYHTSLHDPCKVRAAVFGDGQQRVALVGIDASAIGRRIVVEAREEIARKSGIPANAVLICASHSHSSGPVGMIERGEYDHAPEFVRKLAYEQSTVDDPVYTERVRRAIVNAVVTADTRRGPGVCGAGAGYEDQVAFNRRFRMKNGQSWTHPGQGNPEIIEPAGPIDPVVGVIGGWDANGRLRGCVVNYCCHATTNPGGISANWIYYLEQAIRGAFDHDLVVVFLQGTAGDVTQVDNRTPYRRMAGDAEARLVGGCVGAEAVRVLLSMHRGSLTPVAAASRVLRIPRRPPSPEHLRRANEIVRMDPKRAGMTEWIFAKETVMLDARLQKAKESEVEVQAVQVGPAVFLANPAELFCEYGLQMRKGSRFPLTMPVAYANGAVGYVPTEEAFGPHGGGYETRLTSYSNLVPTAGRQITETALELAASLTPGRMPEPPRAAPGPPRPWPYGNVPPEIS